MVPLSRPQQLLPQQQLPLRDVFQARCCNVGCARCRNRVQQVVPLMLPQQLLPQQQLPLRDLFQAEVLQRRLRQFKAQVLHRRLRQVLHHLLAHMQHLAQQSLRTTNTSSSIPECGQGVSWNRCPMRHSKTSRAHTRAHSIVPGTAA